MGAASVASAPQKELSLEPAEPNSRPLPWSFSSDMSLVSPGPALTAEESGYVIISDRNRRSALDPATLSPLGFASLFGALTLLVVMINSFLLLRDTLAGAVGAVNISGGDGDDQALLGPKIVTAIEDVAAEMLGDFVEKGVREKQSVKTTLTPTESSVTTSTGSSSRTEPPTTSAVTTVPQKVVSAIFEEDLTTTVAASTSTMIPITMSTATTLTTLPTYPVYSSLQSSFSDGFQDRRQEDCFFGTNFDDEGRTTSKRPRR